MSVEQLQQRVVAAKKALSDYEYSSGTMARYNPTGFQNRVTELQREVNQAERALVDAQHQQAQQDLTSSVLADAQVNRVRLEQERQQAQAERQAQQEAAFKDNARRLYVEANGSAIGFDESWPAMKADFVKKHVLSKLDEAKLDSDPVERFLAKMERERETTTK